MKRQVKKFDKKLNMDTATAEKIQKTNQELSNYLKQKGETVAAQQVDYLIQNQGKDSKASITKNPVFDKLLVTNQKILAIIKKMQEDMIDEQDTSIKKVEKSEKEAPATIINNYYGDGEGGGGGLSLDLDFDRRRKIGIDKKQEDKKKKDKKGKGKGKAPGGKGGNVPGTGGKGEEKTPKGRKGNRAARRAAAKKASEKAAEKAASAAAGKAIGKGAAGKGGKIISKLLGFVKPIPLLGTAIAAASAIYSAVDGWENASEITGIPEDNLTTSHKLAASAGAVVSDFTFGIVGSDTIAKAALNFMQPNDVAETEKKYVEAGIIEDPIFGNNKVLDWVELEKLPSHEIEKIIEIDDWSEEDKKKLWDANKRAAEREGVVSERSYLDEETIKKNAAGEQVNPSVGQTQHAPTAGSTSPTAPSTGGTSPTAPSTGSTGASSGGTNKAPQTGSGKYAGKSGAPIPDAEQSKAPIISVEDFGPGWNVVKRSDGTVEKRIGNRNWRNNNPGNIEFGSFTQGFGALAGDPRFAIFPTYTHGRDAKRALIFNGKNYANLSLSQAIARYAPATENDVGMYVRVVLNAVGVEKIMKDYSTGEQDTILNAMQRVEGWAIGRVELIEKGTGETDATKQAAQPGNTGGSQGAQPGSGGTTTSSGGSNTASNGGSSGGSTTGEKNASTGSNVNKDVKQASTTNGGKIDTSNIDPVTLLPKKKPAETQSTEASTPDKKRGETVTEQNAQALVQQKKQADAKQSASTAKALSSVQANINSSKTPKQDVGQDRLLNYFT